MREVTVSGPGRSYTHLWADSLAVELGQKSDDFASYRGSGRHPGYAQAYGKQYVSFPKDLFPLAPMCCT